MLYNIILFKIFSAGAIFFAFLIFFFSNPIYSIFSLIMSFFCSILLLFLLHVEFLAYIFLIMYIGAIAVLFLFVIMMLNIKKSESKQYSANVNYYLDCSILFILAIKLLLIINVITPTWFINYNFNIPGVINYGITDIFIFSNFLYTDFFFNFLVVGVILFVAMVGTLILATNKKN